MSLIPKRELSEEREAQILEELLNGSTSLKRDPPSPGSAPYQHLIFEAVSPRDVSKKIYYFNQSLDSLQKRGYQRHARPAEAFGLLAAVLNGTLSPAQKKIADDLLDSYGEWLSAAVETRTEEKLFSKKKKILSVYLDPLVEWNGKKYVWKNGTSTYTEKQEFDITGKAAEKLIDLREFPDDFVSYIYGCQFKDLPLVMRQGDKRAQVYLPPDEQIRPAGRGNFVNYNLGCYGYGGWASRGVVVVGAPKK